MNISQLNVGDTYKNYKQLCSSLNVNTKTGNAKKVQLKDFERYFKYERKGHTFTITHIYEHPLPENNNKTKYIPTIEKLILDKVVPLRNDGNIFISKNKLLEELRMINENYAYAKYKQLRLSKHLDITLEEIEDFYTTSDDLLKRNIEAALNSLRNQSLIFWSHAITLCFIDTDAETNKNNKIKANAHESYNEYGEKEVSFSTVKPVANRIYRKATNEEVELVLSTERNILLKYDCESKHDIFKRGLVNIFYKEVRDILFDKANIYFYYNSYEIICNEKYIYSKWEELEVFELKQKERELSKDILNNDITNKIIINAERRHERANEQKENNKKVINEEKMNMRLNKNYKENNFKLTETLINKDALPLNKEFAKMDYK